MPPRAPAGWWTRPSAGSCRSSATTANFAQVAPTGPATVRVAAVPGWRAVRTDRLAGTVTVPRHVALDLGATAKAGCADRAAAAVAVVTGSGVLVNLGGDIAVAGEPPAEGWVIRIADRHDADAGDPAVTVAIRSGGLATSGTAARRWERGGRQLHHIVDPATGTPAARCWRTVSVTAETCLAANTASTAAIILGADAPRVARRPRPPRPAGDRGRRGGGRRRLAARGPGRRRSPTDGGGPGVMILTSTPLSVWYLMRGSGLVALVLFSTTVALGVVGVRRWQSSRWTRVVTGRAAPQSGPAGLLLPGHPRRDGGRGQLRRPRVDRDDRPLPLDLSPALGGHGRARLRPGAGGHGHQPAAAPPAARSWRLVHWLTWLMWPIAVVHGLGSGTDHRSFGLYVCLACIAMVAAAGLWRLTPVRARPTAARSLTPPRRPRDHRQESFMTPTATLPRTDVTCRASGTGRGRPGRPAEDQRLVRRPLIAGPSRPVGSAPHPGRPGRPGPIGRSPGVGAGPASRPR